jgi:CDP-glucose 4,6-dehydratase
LDDAFWNGRRVLVTGHTGFKGAWLSLWLQSLGARVAGIALPPASPTAAYGAMAPWSGLDSVITDIRDAEAVSAAVKRHSPEIVLHLAAQALVRRGYHEPVATYETNVMGTIHLLRAVESCDGVKAVVVVTSDKVYANDGQSTPFREGDRLGHTDPYSNSKACAELVAAAWKASFLDARGIAMATARAGNVIGGGDEAEDRLLPDARRAVEAGQPLRLRNPDSVRPWQHVLEPLAGYLDLAEALVTRTGSAPEAVNFGPPDESCRPVRDVIGRVFELWGEGSWALAKGAHPAEAHTLRLDSSVARERLGWAPRLAFDEALRWTVDWWRAQHDGRDMRGFSLEQIARYTDLLGAAQ